MVLRCVAEGRSGGHQCQDDAYYVLIYSCFEEHIREAAMCDLHAGEWLQRLEQKKWSCNYCPYKTYIEEVHLCLVEEVKIERLNL